jgi:DnaJ family protein C protein 28
MPSVRREGDKREIVWSWESHVDRMIREAQARGDFDNLPGAGKPLDLEDNVFAGEMQSAYRIAKNAAAAPLWVHLDREIGEDSAALDALLERTARSLEALAARAATGLAAERRRARALYLQKSADLDKRIEEYNAQRPRTLSWLEKTRLLPAVAARRFDARIPPFDGERDGRPTGA